MRKFLSIFVIVGALFFHSLTTVSAIGTSLTVSPADVEKAAGVKIQPGGKLYVNFFVNDKPAVIPSHRERQETKSGNGNFDIDMPDGSTGLLTLMNTDGLEIQPGDKISYVIYQHVDGKDPFPMVSGVVPADASGQVSFASVTPAAAKEERPAGAEAKFLAGEAPKPTDFHCAAKSGKQGINTSFGCIDPSIEALVSTIIAISLGVAGGFAFLLMVLGSIKMITSNGSPDAIQEGRTYITSAVAGVLVIIFSIFILRFFGRDVLNLPYFGGRNTTNIEKPGGDK